MGGTSSATRRRPTSTPTRPRSPSRHWWRAATTSPTRRCTPRSASSHHAAGQRRVAVVRRRRPELHVALDLRHRRRWATTSSRLLARHRRPDTRRHRVREPDRLVALAAADESTDGRRPHRQPERQLRREHVRHVADGAGTVQSWLPIMQAGRRTVRSPVPPIDPPPSVERRVEPRGRCPWSPRDIHRMTAARAARGSCSRSRSPRRSSVPGRPRARRTAQACSAHAVVVVEPGPGAVTICFNGTISGLDALQLAGANPVTYGFSGQGAAVCQLFGVGNPADSSCLVGPGGQYWAYYRAAPGAGGWTYSRGGASSTTVVDGSVEGWRYGTGGAPGFVSYCAVVGCGPPPTDPPPSDRASDAPPVTAAPSATRARRWPPTAAGTAPATRRRRTRPSRARAATRTPAPSGDAAADGKDGATSTTGQSGTTDQRSAARTAPTRAGSRPRGGTRRQRWWAGSPSGLIVAVASSRTGSVAGLWLRRRRRGPAPG